jgi:hypothetical protein
MQKPDFSGTWKFNPDKSVLQIPAPDSTVFVVDHREPIFRLSRTHVVGESSDTFTLDLTTDNREVVMVRGDLRLRARAYWESETLVFDSHINRGGEDATNVVRYTLDGTLDSFVAEEQFRSKSLSYDNIWVLEKQE